MVATSISLTINTVSFIFYLKISNLRFNVTIKKNVLNVASIKSANVVVWMHGK